MKVITSHQNLDFDGLAAMIGYNILNKDSKMVVPPKLNQNVRAFYSLYKDMFPFIEKITFNINEIEELIIVDTRDENRIGKLKDAVGKVNKLVLYDHHLHKNITRTPTYELCEEIGATTTILVEKIKENCLDITSIEATVLALGIYEDTGNLTYNSTTTRDVKAVSFLLEQGAQLEIIRDYVTLNLTDNQRLLLDELLDNTNHISINDYQIGVSVAKQDEYLNGAAILVHKLMEIENADLFFIIVKMGKKVFLIGRSKREEISIPRILKPFDGKGHDQAASAVIKDVSIHEIKEKLIESLKLRLPVHICARTIMSSPVNIISASTTINKAEKLLHKYGHSGLPVVNSNQDDNANKEELLGIISRRDVEKAKHHGFGHSSVKGYMSQKPITITPDATLKEIQHLIVSNDIGRLPVVDNNDNLVGIVTRTDLLQIQHGIENKETEKNNFYLEELEKNTTDITELMTKRLPDKVMGILYLIGKKADKEGYKVYGVGGFVRDLLLGKDNLDLDLVVENDAISFAKSLKNYLNGKLKTFPQYQTARLTLPSGKHVDFATARIEYYAFPAASPEVEQSTIKQDLYRRDFTINTLAVKLNGSTFGKLLDFFDGAKDLKEGIIRVLYNLSFVEDPTRIFRGIRFEARFNFTIEDQTLLFMKNSLITGVLDKLPGEKLYEEFRNVFYEENFMDALMKMDEIGIFENIFPDLKLNENKIETISIIQDILQWYEQRSYNKSVSKEVLIFSCLFYDQPAPIVSSLSERLKIPTKIREVIFTTINHENYLTKKLEEDLKNSELVELLDGYPLETILFVLARKDNKSIKEKVYYFLENLKGVGISITGEDLKNLGIKPGPIYKKALEEVRKARLDGIVSTSEEELEYVLDFFAKKGERLNG
ncbi:CBS domain-containing protein [Natranaerobius trueperi]|uniref:Polynucleotide adenylyltransferase n=1 Tax=Natranaerobius trueperi TaxID=759412 RepID=A0A226BYG7_9FIRM|nr:CBS domain-containing protein [Natranaerobius trueperi]OWZ83975.1 polynucleotide adenylyltransferase [Natranaerobius trueperi]